MRYRYHPAPPEHDITTDFKIGDLVCLNSEYVFGYRDIYRKYYPSHGDVGIIKEIRYFYRIAVHSYVDERKTTLCEMEIYWPKKNITTYEMEKNIVLLEDKKDD